jgi:hypothetical protein
MSKPHSTRRRCDACKLNVARSWFARHQASGCVVAPGHIPTEVPKFWLDSSLRLRPFATLARNGGYYGVRHLGQRKKRRWEPM